jgi:hypothetical protein
MPEPHKDRRAGLIAFGVLHILLGCLSILLLLATAASAELIARRGTPNAPQVNVAQGLLFYGAAAFYFIAVGIGSIRGRRWARALAAAVSAIWTVAGVFTLAVLFIVLPHVMVLIPPSQEAAVRASSIAFVIVVMILLPLAMALFYASRDTALTSDELDPRIRWTDRVPVAVLALCVALAFGAVTMLVNSAKPVYVFFGHVLTGAPAALAVIALAILFAYLAVQVYRLRESAWWVLLLLHVIAGAMTVAALGQTNLNDIYQRMGLLTPQVQAMHLEQITGSAALWATITLGWIAYLWFLLWLRRYFVGRGEEEAPSPVLST